MFLSTLQTYIRGILSLVPWEHWAIMGGLTFALTVFLLLRKKSSVYGAIALGLSVFVGLVLMDTAVVIRRIGLFPHWTGFNLILELDRLLHGSELGRTEAFSNLAVYVPFGFFLTEFQATRKRFGSWRRIGLATLSGFALSLCIESLQLVLRVGFFELTDLVMNTVGAGVGAGMAAIVRSVVTTRR